MVVRVPRIVIIGGGTDGTLTANRPRRVYGDSAQITVADRDDLALLVMQIPLRRAVRFKPGEALRYA